MGTGTGLCRRGCGGFVAAAKNDVLVIAGFSVVLPSESRNTVVERHFFERGCNLKMREQKRPRIPVSDRSLLRIGDEPHLCTVMFRILASCGVLKELVA